jgi:hypothetical protein
LTDLFSKSSNKVGLLVLGRIDRKSRSKSPHFGFSSLHLDALLLLLLVVDKVGCGTESSLLDDGRREEFGQMGESDLKEVGECFVPARQLPNAGEWLIN